MRVTCDLGLWRGETRESRILLDEGEVRNVAEFNQAEAGVQSLIRPRRRFAAGPSASYSIESAAALVCMESKRSRRRWRLVD
jgi:hypothetical protein